MTESLGDVAIAILTRVLNKSKRTCYQWEDTDIYRSIFDGSNDELLLKETNDSLE